MATKKPTNKELLNAIRSEASAEYKERVPELTSDRDAMAVASAFDSYPSVKNEFINALNGKVFKSMVMNKVWNNPLAMLKKGELKYGQGIEQLFVELAEKKNFWEHFNKRNDAANTPGTPGLTDADDLLGQHNSKVVQKFIQRNFQYKYKVSLSNERLRNAFSSATGVADLIDGMVASVMTGANYQEFDDMLKILVRADTVANTGGTPSNAADKGLGIIEKGIVDRMCETSNTSGATKYYVQVKTGQDHTVDPRDLAEKIRTYASEFSFLSDKYNLARVKTSCNPEDLVLFTTSDVVAKLDVQVLANAFNVSSADVNVRVIKVPIGTFKQVTGHFGTVNNTSRTPIAVLADKEAIQQYDTLVESGSFYNPEKLMTNMFVHRQGITASCEFANCIVFGLEAE